MARIEWVKHRLDNWARWKVAGNAHGLGWSSQSVLLSAARADTPQVRIPVDEIEAGVTDQAVESLRHKRPHLYRVLQCIYPQGKGVHGTAQACTCSVSTVHSLLGVADLVLARWFADRADQQAQLRESIKKSFTT